MRMSPSASSAAIAVRDDEGGHAGARGVDAGAAQLDRVEGLTGELLHHARPAHERVGLLGHHHLVGQPEQERRARHDRAGGREQHRHAPRAAHQGPGRRPPTGQGGHAVVDVGPARGDEPEQREPGATGVVGGRREHQTVGFADGAPSLLGGDLDEDDVAPDHRGELCGQRPGMVGGDGDDRHVVLRPRRARGRYARGTPSVATGCTPSRSPDSRSTVCCTASRRARAGADRSPRRRRASPTERRASPSTATRSQLPGEPVRRGGGGHDGRPEALEGECGDEAEAVHLGPRAQGHPDGGGLRVAARRGTTCPWARGAGRGRPGR